MSQRLYRAGSILGNYAMRKLQRKAKVDPEDLIRKWDIVRGDKARRALLFFPDRLSLFLLWPGVQSELLSSVLPDVLVLARACVASPATHSALTYIPRRMKPPANRFK